MYTMLPLFIFLNNYEIKFGNEIYIIVTLVKYIFTIMETHMSMDEPPPEALFFNLYTSFLDTLTVTHLPAP